MSRSLLATFCRPQDLPYVTCNDVVYLHDDETLFTISIAVWRFCLEQPSKTWLLTKCKWTDSVPANSCDLLFSILRVPGCFICLLFQCHLANTFISLDFVLSFPSSFPVTLRFYLLVTYPKNISMMCEYWWNDQRICPICVNTDYILKEHTQNMWILTWPQNMFILCEYWRHAQKACPMCVNTNDEQTVCSICVKNDDTSQEYV